MFISACITYCQANAGAVKVKTKSGPFMIVNLYCSTRELPNSLVLNCLFLYSCHSFGLHKLLFKFISVTLKENQVRWEQVTTKSELSS